MPATELKAGARAILERAARAPIVQRFWLWNWNTRFHVEALRARGYGGLYWRRSTGRVEFHISPAGRDRLERDNHRDLVPLGDLA